jgi:hypothetical protein
MELSRLTELDVDRRIPKFPLHLTDSKIDGAVSDLAASQCRGYRLQERRSVGGRERLRGGRDGGELGIGEGDRAGHSACYHFATQLSEMGWYGRVWSAG